MKKNIHPAYSALQVKCSSCKKLDIVTASTLKQEIFYTEKCIHCHSAYTKRSTQTSTVKRTNSRQRQGFSLSELAK